MKHGIVVPTREEIRTAWEDITADIEECGVGSPEGSGGRIALAMLQDAVIRQFIERTAQTVGQENDATTLSLLIAAFAGGLNYGLRIGEARRK